MAANLDSEKFRRVLGHYPTGFCAITAMSGARPVGMIVGSSTSVSLDPPLVAFRAARTSTIWPAIAAAGRFCVNVPSDRQENVCQALSLGSEKKFETVSHRLSDSDLSYPGQRGRLDRCLLYAVHEAGDHCIAIGEVRTLDAEPSHPPLKFCKGGYGGLALSTARA